MENFGKSLDDDEDILKPDEETKDTLQIVTREDKKGSKKGSVERSKRKTLKRGFKRGMATTDDAAKLLAPADPGLTVSKFKSEAIKGAPEDGGSSSSN